MSMLRFYGLIVFLSVGIFAGWLAMHLKPGMNGGVAFLIAVVPAVAATAIFEWVALKLGKHQ